MRLFSSISSKEKFDLFIIDNSNGKDEIVTSSIQIVKDRLESVGSKLFHEKYKNIGVAASWNKFIKFKEENNYDYLFVFGNDIEVSENTIDDMIVFEKEHNDGVIYFGDAGHNAWMISDRFSTDIGEYDENFFPAYYEDNDQMYRKDMLGLKYYDVPNVHINNDDGSQTINNNEYLKINSGYVFELNKVYYILKWGGEPGKEIFKTPFNKDDDINCCDKSEGFIDYKKNIFNKHI